MEKTWERIVRWVFAKGAGISAGLCWTAGGSIFVTAATTCLYLRMGWDINEVIFTHSCEVIGFQLAGAASLAITLKYLARATYPDMDCRPVRAHAYATLKPPFWAKPLVRAMAKRG